MYPVSYPPKGEGISLSSGHRGALQEPGTRRRLFNESLFPSGRTRLTAVSLQVSGENEPALALYKKTGFRITETLSFYLY